MFDPKRTLELVKGALLDAEPTWRSYLPEAGDWKKTAFLLTGPLIVAAALIAYLLGFAGSDSSVFGQFRPTLGSTLISMVLGAVAITVVALIVSALAGAFGGKNSFALGLATVSLAFVPGYLGQALAGLPWIGGLLALLLFIYALVLLWRIIPVYLEVPDGKRGLHYISSIAAIFFAMVIIGGVFGRFMPGADIRDRYELGDVSPGSGDFAAPTGGIVGSAMRQAELLASAEEDRYTPPANGELSKAQVEEFVRVMNRSAEMRASKEARLKAMAEKAEQEEQVSFSDLTDMMGGVADIAGFAGAEMEIVKSAGGNWAEHVWVRDTMRTAWLQQDINDAVKHNYRLFKTYEDDLAKYIAK